MREFVSAKIHGLTITGKSLEYEGSATIPDTLMKAAGIAAYERVYLVNKSNGLRWDTYALPGPEGEFVMNGAAARLGEIGDEILVWTFRREENFSGANVVFVDEANEAKSTTRYTAE
jgi:aspartate 1-decarboxylase